MEDSTGDEQLVLNAAVESLKFNSKNNNYTDGEPVMDAPDENEAPIPEFINGGSYSDLPQNGEIAAEIASAKAISVARLKSPITYNLYAIAVSANTHTHTTIMAYF